MITKELITLAYVMPMETVIGEVKHRVTQYELDPKKETLAGLGLSCCMVFLKFAIDNTPGGFAELIKQTEEANKLSNLMRRSNN